MLEVTDLHVNYGPVRAVHGVSFSATAGRVTLVLGANGAGKTTSLRAVAGFHKPASGKVVLEGKDLTGTAAHRVVKHGMVLVPEGRKIFFPLTVEENLRIGGYAAPRGNLGKGIEEVYEKFPILGDRRHSQAGLLSGGEQQMLAFGRGLMTNPRLLLVDEMSLGLAPVVVKQLYDVLATIAAEGMTTIVVEQDISQVLRVARHVFCFRRGTVSLAGRPAELTRPRIAAAYFGA